MASSREASCAGCRKERSNVEPMGGCAATGWTIREIRPLPSQNGWTETRCRWTVALRTIRWAASMALSRYARAHRDGARKAPHSGLALALRRARHPVGHVSAHELIETGHGEVDVPVVLGGVDQPLVDQVLAGHRYLGRYAPELGRHVARAIGPLAELSHRAHVATLLAGRSLDAHLVDARVQGLLRNRDGGPHICRRDRGDLGEVPGVLAELLDVERVAT